MPIVVEVAVVEEVGFVPLWASEVRSTEEEEVEEEVKGPPSQPKEELLVELLRIEHYLTIKCHCFELY